MAQDAGSRRRLSNQGLELLKAAALPPPPPPPKPDHFKPNWLRSGIVQQLRLRGITKMWKHVFLELKGAELRILKLDHGGQPSDNVLAECDLLKESSSNIIFRSPGVENGFQIEGQTIDWKFRTEEDTECTKWICALQQNLKQGQDKKSMRTAEMTQDLIGDSGKFKTNKRNSILKSKRTSKALQNRTSAGTQLKTIGSFREFAAVKEDDIPGK